MTKVEFDGCVRKATRNVLTEFNVDERPLACEGCRHFQMPSLANLESSGLVAGQS
jgi:hypothetical protein